METMAGLSHEDDSSVAADLQRKIFLLSTEVLDLALSSSESNADNLHNGDSSDRQRQQNQLSHWIPFVDNASLRYPTTSNDLYDNDGVCEEQSLQRLVWRILYWIKRIVLWLTRHYHADTAVLLLLPMITGVLIGIWFGRRLERGSQRKPRQSWTSLMCVGIPASLMLRVWELLESLFSSSQHYLKIDNNKNNSSESTDRSKDVVLQLSSPSMEAFATQREPQRPTLLYLLDAAADKTLETPSVHFPKTSEELISREESTRSDLNSDRDTLCESGIPESNLPRHIAFIMDGNRRYGRKVYGNRVAGHWDGSRKVLDVAKWCIAEKIPHATVYAFSTENWKRDPAEVASLMEIFAKYCEELRSESIQHNIRVRILSTDPSPIPFHVAAGLQRLQDDTENCTGLCLNVCLSYGSRSEMVQVCQSLVTECMEQKRDPSSIKEEDLTARLLTKDGPDPDILIRTSGEMRLSNYLLWQLAYAELFFLDKNWPELQKDDFLEVIRSYAFGRKRRFGK